jgi:hypothetical protein
LPGQQHHGGECDHQHCAGQLRDFAHFASPNIADTHGIRQGERQTWVFSSTVSPALSK